MKGFDRLCVLVVCLLLTPAVARAAGCSDVSWLDPGKAPRFLADVDQAAGSGNCQFHEFAAQNFFALALGSSPAIRTWPTALQVYPAEGATTCGAPAPLGSTVGPLLRKGPSSAVGEIIQASTQPLVDQNGRYVQYEIRVNPRFCEVVSRCQLYNKDCATKAAATDVDFRFPAGDAYTPGVAEVKIAWRVMETCDLPDSPQGSACKKDNLADFLTLKNITIKPYSPKNPGEVKVTLGLVGFHLIQKTATHPEYVWSTWEHVSNAPVCAGADNTACQDPSAASASIGTASGWSLASPPASTDPQCGVIVSDPAANFDQNPPVPNCANISYYTKPEGSTDGVDPNQPKTQTCRTFPCGGGDQADLASLNKALRAKLAGHLWSRYFLVGTLWGQQPLPTDRTVQVPAAGSVILGNTTMETFVQPNKNCFFCHRGASPDFVHSMVRSQQAGSCPATVDFTTCAGAPAIQPIHSSRP